jgi:hypothetical protein
MLEENLSPFGEQADELVRYLLRRKPTVALFRVAKIIDGAKCTPDGGRTLLVTSFWEWHTLHSHNIHEITFPLWVVEMNETIFNAAQKHSSLSVDGWNENPECMTPDGYSIRIGNSHLRFR